MFTIMDFCTSRVLKVLNDIYVKHYTGAGAAELEQFSRAALCHVLVTSEPQLEGDLRAQTYGENASVSVEEIIFLVCYLTLSLT